MSWVSYHLRYLPSVLNTTPRSSLLKAALIANWLTGVCIGCLIYGCDVLCAHRLGMFEDRKQYITMCFLWGICVACIRADTTITEANVKVNIQSIYCYFSEEMYFEYGEWSREPDDECLFTRLSARRGLYLLRYCSLPILTVSFCC